MPARDRYHDCVRTALAKDGWIITHDPLRLSWGGKDLSVDLGAEQLLGAEKGERRIAVEIKSFLGDSQIDDLEKALGQFVLYRAVLAARQPDRVLFLAVPEDTAQDVFDAPLGRLMVADRLVRVLGFDSQNEVITRWIHETD
jgi:hypothetical protein